MDWTRPAIAAVFGILVTALAPEIGRAVATLVFLPAVFGVVYTLRYWHHFVHNLGSDDWTVDEYRIALSLMEAVALVRMISELSDTPSQLFEDMRDVTARWVAIAVATHLGATITSPEPVELFGLVADSTLLTAVVLPPVFFLALGVLAGVFIVGLDALQLWLVEERARNLARFSATDPTSS